MFFESFFSAFFAVLGDASSRVAMWVAEKLRVPHHRWLRLALQFLVFAAVLVALFVAVGALALGLLELASRWASAR